MEDNKELAAKPEILSDVELTGVSGGATSTTDYWYYCPTCSSKLRKKRLLGIGTYLYCDTCEDYVDEEVADVKGITTTIDGEVHTVSGEF